MRIWRVPLKVEVHCDAAAPLTARRIRNAARKVLKFENHRAKGCLSIVLVDDPKIRELNQRFLHRNGYTDVISFPLGDNAGVAGETYISVDRARAQAEAYRIPVEEELVRLVIHGVLHLIGYEDGTRQGRENMRKREEGYLRRILRDGRVAQDASKRGP